MSSRDPTQKNGVNPDAHKEWTLQCVFLNMMGKQTNISLLSTNYIGNKNTTLSEQFQNPIGKP